MMQRLQSFQDAQPSSYAILPTKEGAEANNQHSPESLAAEFQSLLAQIAGHLSGIPDQLSALGLSFTKPSATTVKKTAQSEIRAQGEVASSDIKELESSGFGAISEGEVKVRDDSNKKIDEEGNDAETAQNKAQADRSDDFTQNLADINVARDISIQDEVSRFAIDLAISQNSKSNNMDLPKEIIIDAEASFVDIDNQTELIDPAHIQGSIADSEKLPSDLMAFGGDLTLNSTLGGSNQKKSGDDAEIELDPFAVAASHSSNVELTNNRAAKILARHADQSESATGNSEIVSTQLNGLSEAIGIDKNHPKNREETQPGDIIGNQRSSQTVSSDSSLLGLKSNHMDLNSDYELFNPDGQAQYQNEQQNAASRAENNMHLLILRHAFDGAKSPTKSEAADLMRSRAQDNLAIQGGNNKLEAKATASEQSARSRPMTRPQLTRMLERVESTLKEVARSRDGKTISLKLEPVDLGRVKVDVSLRDGVLHARISPDSQQVMTALREHAHELQGTLRKLGLEVDSVTVSVTADEFSNQMNGGNGGANSGSSFRDERHNMPNSGIQVPENMNGNELAAGVLGNTEGTSSAALIEDHWVA